MCAPKKLWLMPCKNQNQNTWHIGGLLKVQRKFIYLRAWKKKRKLKNGKHLHCCCCGVFKCQTRFLFFKTNTHSVNWAIHLGMWLHQIHQMAHCMNTQAHFSSLRTTAILLGQKSKRYYFFAARNFCSTHTAISLVNIVYHTYMYAADLFSSN